MSALLQDLRYAARSLARSPGWTFAAVLTLALGVAANTTVFRWMRAVVLEPIPGASEPSRLRVLFARTPAGEPARFSYPDFRDLERASEGAATLVAQRWVSVALGANSTSPSQLLSGALVSANYFEMLGAHPVIGRGFRREEDAGRGAPPVAVLSHALWQRSFAGDRSAVGRAVLLNGQPFTIIGVAPPGFFGSFLSIGVDVFVPLAQVARLDPAGDRTVDRRDRWLLCLARLKAGVSTERTREILASEAARLNRDFPGVHDGYGIGIVRLSASPWGGPAELGPIVLTLAAVVVLVLVLSCANVANLLVNRALGRRREIAMRLALGASRWQIARQHLFESLGLAFLAASAAAICAIWTSGLLLSFIPPTGFPVRLDLRVDAGVVGYALLVSVAGILLFGLAPSLQVSRKAVAADLAAGATAVIGTRGRARLRSALVMTQVALSLVLLAVAGLFLRSLLAGRQRNPGFETENLLLVGLKLFPAGYTPENGLPLLDRLEQRVGEIPGVRSAALARRAPLGFGGFPSTAVDVEGYASPAHEEIRTRFNTVSAGYFRTLICPIRRGREFDRSDRLTAEPVAIVNEAFTRRYFAGREALGGRIRSEGLWRRIVGVAADGKYERLDETPLPFLFLPLAQAYSSDVELHVRTSGDPAAALPAVRQVLANLDRNLPPFEVQTMEQHLDEELFAQRVASSLLGVLGLLALVISGVGLYALAAHSVAERRREIGLRMALGAAPRQLLRSFLAAGFRTVGGGVAAGLLAALAIGRVIASQIKGVSPSDPAVLAGVTLITVLISAAAIFIPARRASRLNPIEALRND